MGQLAHRHKGRAGSERWRQERKRVKNDKPFKMRRGVWRKIKANNDEIF